MADILLIHAPLILYYRGEEVLPTVGDEVSNYHMGLLYLASYAEKQGASVKILEVTASKLTWEDVRDSINEEKPVVIGITATSASARSAVKLCREIRKNIQDCPAICIGGAHVNSDPHFIDRVAGFDFAVAGEGEKTFYDAYVKIKNGEKVERILHGEAIDNLDDIPFPARHLVDLEIFQAEEKKIGWGPAPKPWATMLGSRGCPFKCTFCAIPVIKHKVRYRGAKNIVDEMELIYDQCDGKYSFVDDVLTLNVKRSIELCDEILRRGLGEKVRWIGMTRADVMTDELAKKLAMAGCENQFFGVESGSPRIRAEVIDKDIPNEGIKNAVAHCIKHGIHTNFFLMLGFPTETPQDIEDTINIGIEAEADIIGIHQTIPFPGTALYDEAVKEGQIAPDLFDRFSKGEVWDKKDNFFLKWPRYTPKGMDEEFLISAKKRAYRKHYLRPSWVLSRLRHWRRFKWFKHDLELVASAPMTLLRGKTARSVS